MPYTRTQLATRILKDLGLVDARETPEAADTAWVEETIASVAGQLAIDGIHIWGGSDQSLPEPYLVALSKRIGLDVGPSYGLFSIAEAELAKEAANNSLRRLSGSPQKTGAVQTAEYF